MILNVDWRAYFTPIIPVLCLLRRLPPRGRSWTVAVQQCWHGREGHLLFQVVSTASWGLVLNKQKLNFQVLYADLWPHFQLLCGGDPPGVHFAEESAKRVTSLELHGVI